MLVPQNKTENGHQSYRVQTLETISNSKNKSPNNNNKNNHNNNNHNNNNSSSKPNQTPQDEQNINPGILIFFLNTGLGIFMSK